MIFRGTKNYITREDAMLLHEGSFLNRSNAKFIKTAGLATAVLFTFCQVTKRDQTKRESFKEPVSISIDYPADGSIFPPSFQRRHGCGEMTTERFFPGISTLFFPIMLSRFIRFRPVSGFALERVIRAALPRPINPRR